MSYSDDQIIPRVVKTVDFEAIREFVQVKVEDDCQPFYCFSHGRLWKSACWIKVWDDGRVYMVVENHLTPRQRRVVAGLAEEFWRAGPQKCRQESWRRIRRCKSRPVGSWAASFTVLADREDAGYEAAHADHQMVVQLGLNMVDSVSDQQFSRDEETVT